MTHPRLGSPPQVRGKPKQGIQYIKKMGITPAGAGKTIGICFCAGQYRDHPRRCGENVYVFPCVRNKPGSPPQVRGKHFLIKILVAALGITPAGAGKTWDIAFYVGKTQDHPRRCGENKPIWDIGFWGIGSPPQVRGKLSLFSGIVRITGITPAGAGKTRV